MEGDDIYPTLSGFPNLRNFLGVTFPESDLEGWSDEEAAVRYIAENVAIVRESLLKEGTKLLAEPAIPWEEIGKAANRYFENESQAKEWLVKIIHVVKHTKPKTRDIKGP